MKLLSRIVWEEGMYLGPQHFQAQNRYFEDSLQFANSVLRFEPYGFSGCALDEEALQNGTVSLLHARGVFPDGLAFHMPEHDPLPPPRAIGEFFRPVDERLTVHLAIPACKPGGVNVALVPNGAQARYSAESCSMPDETTGHDERPVRLGRKNLRLLFGDEPRDGWTSLPIASVMRDGAGGFRFDPEFVPPCVQISASERLMLLLRSMVEILEQKSTTLAGTSGIRRAEGFSAGEVANYWLRHAVNTSVAALDHLWHTRRGHPEELFLELSRLGGALCTFSVDAHPRDLPLYDHQRLGECFSALDQHIRRHLDLILPTRLLQIPLRKHADYFWEGEVADSRCFGRAGWVLGIAARAGAAELITRTPQLVKICSAKFIGELVRRAMPGLALTHLPAPPPAIPTRVDAQYFSVARAGPFWEHIAQTRRIGIYVPGDFPGADLELLVVLES